MELAATASMRWRRVAPAACGCAAAATALVIAANDPAAAGSRFPACSFHEVTGLWCPGCGLTRGVHQLLRGDLVGAVSHNLFTPLVVVALIGGWLLWTRRAWGHPARPVFAGIPRWAGAATIAAIVLYGVLRNIPTAPFAALAP